MKVYDWLVVGGGLTGAALSYELAASGFSVLLIDHNQNSQGATRFSYGGIPYWAGTSELTKQLAKEGLDYYHQLSQALDQDIEFRQIDLLLTIAANTNPQNTYSEYKQFAIQPQLLDVQSACELEPIMIPDNISGAIYYQHAHVNPELLGQAYQTGLTAHGGEICHDQVISLEKESVKGLKSTYQGKNIAVCAGGMGRSLLKNAGLAVKLYFTHAEVIETVPTDLTLRTLVMPAITQWMRLESEVRTTEQAWNYDNHQVSQPAIDSGAIQFNNRQLRIGQLSCTHTNPDLERDLKQSEILIRTEVAKILPAIASIKGTCHHCLIAFSPDSLPLVGEVNEHIHLFSGFTSPFIYVPPLAKRFAASVSGNSDLLLTQLSPHRFGNS